MAVAVLSLAVVSDRPTSAQQLSGSVNVPQGVAELGSVELPRRVMANSQALPAGTYEVRLTSQTASGDSVGALSILERWVEFRQDGDVKGREVVSIVPQAEVSDVAKSAPPASGSARVEQLRENDYLRVWINLDGTAYLIHLGIS